MFYPVNVCSSHPQILIKVEPDVGVSSGSGDGERAARHHHCYRYESTTASTCRSSCGRASPDFVFSGSQGITRSGCTKERPELAFTSSSDCCRDNGWLSHGEDKKRTSSLSSSTAGEKEQKRDRANEQERRRMKQINDALDDLRLVLRDKPIPILSPAVHKHRESKIKTLTAAIAYIKFLQEQLRQP